MSEVPLYTCDVTEAREKPGAPLTFNFRKNGENRLMDLPGRERPGPVFQLVK